MLYREGTIQVNLYHANLLALGVEVIDSVADSFCRRAHDDDDFFCVGSAVVVKELVVAACQFIDFIHVMLYDAGDGSDFFVRPFFALEEDIRIDRRAAFIGMFRIQGVFAEGVQLIVVDELFQFVVVQRFDTLHFVRCTEAVEHVHEGIASADCR